MNGNIASTKMICFKTCKDEIGDIYKEGDAWTCADECNKCRCLNGKITSTKAACPRPGKG